MRIATLVILILASIYFVYGLFPLFAGFGVIAALPELFINVALLIAGWVMFKKESYTWAVCLVLAQAVIVSPIFAAWYYYNR